MGKILGTTVISNHFIYSYHWKPPQKVHYFNYIFFNCIIGDGAYSSVYKVRRAEDNDVYALKKVKMLNLSDKEKENALNEVRILASITHANVIQYKEAFIDETSSSLW